MTGIAAFDQLAVESSAFAHFIQKLGDQGWIVKATTRLPPQTPAYFFPRKRRFYYNPEKMTVVDMLHENVHLDQFASQGSWKIGGGLGASMEAKAYQFEYELGKKKDSPRFTWSTLKSRFDGIWNYRNNRAKYE